jgi:hypothetical protein
MADIPRRQMPAAGCLNSLSGLLLRPDGTESTTPDAIRSRPRVKLRELESQRFPSLS